MKEQHTNKVTLGYKYTKPNKPIMTPILFRVYQVHVSQPNVRDILVGSDKIAYNLTGGVKLEITISGIPVCSDDLRWRRFSNIYIWLPICLGCLILQNYNLLDTWSRCSPNNTEKRCTVFQTIGHIIILVMVSQLTSKSGNEWGIYCCQSQFTKIKPVCDNTSTQVQKPWKPFMVWHQ